MALILIVGLEAQWAGRAAIGDPIIEHPYWLHLGLHRSVSGDLEHELGPPSLAVLHQDPASDQQASGDGHDGDLLARRAAPQGPCIHRLHPGVVAQADPADFDQE